MDNPMGVRSSGRLDAGRIFITPDPGESTAKRGPHQAHCKAAASDRKSAAMSQTLFAIVFAGVVSGCFALASAAQPNDTQFPPADKLPVVKELPDPFLFSDGSRVRTTEDWSRRRAQLQEMILYYQYGRMPAAPGNTKAVELVSSPYKSMAGVTHKVFKVTCGPQNAVSFSLDLMVPKGKGPFPVILRGDWGWAK